MRRSREPRQFSQHRRHPGLDPFIVRRLRRSVHDHTENDDPLRQFIERIQQSERRRHTEAVRRCRGCVVYEVFGAQTHYAPEISAAHRIHQHRPRGPAQ